MEVYHHIVILIQFMVFYVNTVKAIFGETCTIDVYDVHFFGRTTRSEYCLHGCCGLNSRRSCCSSANVGIISGLAVTAIVLIALMILYLYCRHWRRNRNKRTSIVISARFPSDFLEPQGLVNEAHPKVHVINPPDYTPEDAPPSYEDVLRESRTPGTVVQV